MAFYDTQSQLINMARSKERMANAIQNRANSEAKLSQERANAITKGLENVASIAASQIGEYKKEKRDKELLASVVPTLGATEAQKEALLNASNLDEAVKIATIQQSGVETKSLGYGNGLGVNKWTGEITPYINNTRKGGGSGTGDETYVPKNSTRTDNFNSLSESDKQSFINNGGVTIDKKTGEIRFTDKFDSLFSKWNNKRLNR